MIKGHRPPHLYNQYVYMAYTCYAVIMYLQLQAQLVVVRWNLL